jgi:hypothetical protein
MGREVRRVPKNWKHPSNKGRYIPLLEGFAESLKRWETGKEKWDQGFVDDYHGGWKPYDTTDMTFDEWDGRKPEKEDYMPDFPDEEKTHYQMYETCSEGTPISPVMESPEELAKWLADNGASAFGDMSATYEDWLNTINSGGAPGFYILGNQQIISGVEAANRFKKKKDDL